MTELWERFSYYGMRAILVLYLISESDANNPGLNWTEASALEFYGIYTAFVYLACIPGGIIADRYLGKKKSVLVGGGLLCCGHLLLSIDNFNIFLLGISLIIIGVGFLKPNISGLVGDLYEKNDFKREQGFFIFYIGINIGAFIASLVVGYIGEVHGWHYGFSMAGFGMLIGQIIYIKGYHHLEDVKVSKSVNKQKVTHIEKERLKVLLVSFLIVLFFWAAFEQAGGLLNIYTYEKTKRTVDLFNNWEIPASWFQSINPLIIILLGVTVSNYWINRKKLNKQSSSLFKMLVGLIIMGLGFIFMVFASLEYKDNFENSGNGYSSMYWLVLAYLFITIGELCASPVILSFITKLSPERFLSSIMGVYFASVGLGNMLAAKIGQTSSQYGETQIFFGISIFCISFGSILLLYLKSLNNLTHTKDEIS